MMFGENRVDTFCSYKMSEDVSVRDLVECRCAAQQLNTHEVLLSNCGYVNCMQRLAVGYIRKQSSLSQ